MRMRRPPDLSVSDECSGGRQQRKHSGFGDLQGWHAWCVLGPSEKSEGEGGVHGGGLSLSGNPPPRGELVEPRQGGCGRPSTGSCMDGARGARGIWRLSRSGVQVMYSACCCGIEDRWP